MELSSLKINIFSKMELCSSRLKKLPYFLKIIFLIFQEELSKPQKTKFMFLQIKL